MFSLMTEPSNREATGVGTRAAESAVRGAVGLVPILGPVLAEAVGFAWTVRDDREAATFRAEMRRRLESLETTQGSASVTVSGDRAQLLELLVRRGGEEMLRRVTSDEAREKLKLSADAYRLAVRELEDLHLVEVDNNGNDPSGVARAAVFPRVYVQLIGRFDPSIEVSRELGLILRTLERGGDERRVHRDEFAGLGIPIPRLQVLAEFLEERGLAVFRPPGFGEWIFYDAELTTRGRRVLRGDDLPPAQ